MKMDDAQQRARRVQERARREVPCLITCIMTHDDVSKSYTKTHVYTYNPSIITPFHGTSQMEAAMSRLGMSLPESFGGMDSTKDRERIMSSIKSIRNSGGRDSYEFDKMDGNRDGAAFRPYLAHRFPPCSPHSLTLSSLSLLS